MTAITVVAVGRLKAGPLADLATTYLSRMTWPVRVVEVETRLLRDGADLKAREAASLREALPRGATLVALDERGRPSTSPDFAAWIERRRGEGTQHLAFLVGGADGLDPALRQDCALSLAFGAMTWPHMLARIMLLEQLYRAQQILAGHPYHRV